LVIVVLAHYASGVSPTRTRAAGSPDDKPSRRCVQLDFFGELRLF